LTRALNEWVRSGGIGGGQDRGIKINPYLGKHASPKIRWIGISGVLVARIRKQLKGPGRRVAYECQHRRADNVSFVATTRSSFNRMIVTPPNDPPQPLPAWRLQSFLVNLVPECFFGRTM
jgi:hypothetical protein